MWVAVWFICTCLLIQTVAVTMMAVISRRVMRAQDRANRMVRTTLEDVTQELDARAHREIDRATGKPLA